jgi:dextranase
MVHFALSLSEYNDGDLIQIHYFHLSTIIDSVVFPVTTSDIQWDWQAPAKDFKGYLAGIKLIDSNGLPLDQTSIAVDVSSDWNRYPRYGFLSKYPFMNSGDQATIIDKLTRFHINGLQFYDWQWKHHRPLCGTVAYPAYNWDDIANRKNYRDTITRYITLSHQKNIKAMAYNLIYGAYENASNDGVQNSWRLFTDTAHQYPDKHELPDSWASDIYIINPANTTWQNYLINEMNKVFQAFNFDGWHIDQLGNRGNRYDYNGDRVDVENSFQTFLDKIKADLDISIVCNAVDQYAQSKIAMSPVDFLYSEVWTETSYRGLSTIITTNNFASNNQLTSILAAYVNRDISGTPGSVNPAAVLLADAVIFANGAAHLELGEHYLANEYFPNNNLTVSPALNTQLTSYYDFLVAYENLMRDPKQSIPFAIVSNSDIEISKTSEKNRVWVFNKTIDYTQIYHFINFVGVTTMDWRDPEGTQTVPTMISDLPIIMKMDSTVHKIWIASPDTNDCIPTSIPFSQQNDSLLITLPYLKYWTMLVIELESPPNQVQSDHETVPHSFSLGQNFPNPFNVTTSIPISINRAGLYQLTITDVTGRNVYTHKSFYYPGHHTYTIDGQHFSSGIYLYTLSDNNRDQFRKMLLVK